MKFLDQITAEIDQYLFGTVEIADGIPFSEYKLKKRINFFKNRHYPTGKVTDDGDYEFWFDATHPRVMAEVKNLRLDSKYFMVFSKNPIGDFPAVYIANCKLAEFMEETGRDEELNEAVEDFSADGNLLLRKTGDGYERWDMLNTFFTNPTARTVNDTAIIERFYMDQSDLRKRENLFKNVDLVIRDCGNLFFSKTEKGINEPTQTPKYELYRYTGEVSEKELFELQGQQGGGNGDPNKYGLARVVVAGLKKGKKDRRYVLFAEALPGEMKDYFKEAHRGPFKGRWFREGLYELLMDHQVRYNDITNDIARGLSWAGKVFFRHSDIQVLQNIRTSLANGSLIKSEDLQQVQVRMQGFDQLANDRNHVLQDMNFIANSMEIVQGGNLPAGTPLGLAQMMDTNANKLFAFLRKKLSIPFRYVVKDFILPDFVKDVKGKDILRLTGDDQFLDRFRHMIAEGWFNQNLIKIGPHTPEMKAQIIQLKVDELRKKDPTLQNAKDLWTGVLPRLFVTIVGENFNIEEQGTIVSMLQFETDAGRRAFLMDYLYSIRGIPVPPPAAPGQVPQQQNPQPQPTPTPSPMSPASQESVAA